MQAAILYPWTGELSCTDGETIAVLHIHDGMVCHIINQQSSILCVLHPQCQFNKVDRTVPSSITYLRQITFFVSDCEF